MIPLGSLSQPVRGARGREGEWWGGAVVMPWCCWESVVRGRGRREVVEWGVGRRGHGVVLLGVRGGGQGPAGGEGVGRKGCWSRGPPVVGGWRMLMSFAGSGGQAVTQVALTEQEDHDGGDHREDDAG